MSYLPRVLGPLILLVFSGLVSAEDSFIAPQEGALLLRNGSVLQGSVIRLGDRYMVSLGSRAKLFVNNDEVELHCRSSDLSAQKSSCRALSESSFPRTLHSIPESCRSDTPPARSPSCCSGSLSLGEPPRAESRSP